jgi:UDP-glucose 4-epimerase
MTDGQVHCGELAEGGKKPVSDASGVAYHAEGGGEGRPAGRPARVAAATRRISGKIEPHSRELKRVKRILVTGGAGFIGSHLTESLLADGHFVRVVDDESTGSAENLAPLLGHQRLDYRRASIGHPDLVREVMEDVDEVYHLAAAVGVALIARHPIQSIERNIYPTELLFAELLRRHQRGAMVRCFLASTSEVYGKNPKERWSEEDDLVFGPTVRARWSYGASKAIDEFLALAYWREFRLPVVIGRFFNVVGPRQTGAYGMVLPRFVDAALQSRPLIVHDDGRQVRCFAHVRDVISAVRRLMDTAAAAGTVVNIGSDRPVQIRELAELVVKLAGSPSTIEFQSYTEAYDRDFEDVRRRVPDLGRLRSLINFQPQFSLEDIIAEVIDSRRS